MLKCRYKPESNPLYLIVSSILFTSIASKGDPSEFVTERRFAYETSDLAPATWSSSHSISDIMFDICASTSASADAVVEDAAAAAAPFSSFDDPSRSSSSSTATASSRPRRRRITSSTLALLGCSSSKHPTTAFLSSPSNM
jgi:hypothetical protein